MNRVVGSSSKAMNPTPSTTKLTYDEYIKTIKDKKFHQKCRIIKYQFGSPFERVPVKDAHVPWSVKLSKSEYNPKVFTADFVLKDPVTKTKPIWADFDENSEEIKLAKWNSQDFLHNSSIDRSSYECIYEMEMLGSVKVPKNPKGRTGLKGRGALGRWGPNHAADPIVTRWKPGSKKKILEFIAIQRIDTEEWAIPGGMVDPGENVSVTLKKEFGEESLGSMEATEDEKKLIKENVNNLFEKGGRLIYKGYVDDPRNTDNAWMETHAYNFHDEKGLSVSKFKLHAGDDAKGVKWMPITNNIKLYASHAKFVQDVAKYLGVADFK